MRFLVIDGQGGGLGRALVEALRQNAPDAFIIAAGTNALATAAMLRAGADVGATGENAVCYNCADQTLDAVLGPVGILLPNAMYGELTPAMAAAVSGCAAKKVVVPVSKSSLLIAGAQPLPVGELVRAAVALALGENAR